ncbi:UDP-2,3-diacylglucosamine hydrolase [Enterovibrio norvegicus FF-33]|uniref:UDP-2,3-diacylglucosamine hydrolase n=1 Tax=Enterovibrio norvegicus FF-454 TaxID=1185651 RepID=A0A1E5BY03_9GAMM|nr:UDP-2,3-diacylglucosamine diphosphatase [Enterovibrio norvegicus]OEE58118.1 UDP-2,3-diacylglucosamine hydrolase [Enterovibrio norvegicus FF-454]OEE65983.1 UDP-2,3-diacylglucosamine hydrolase [Enterovibrio norvegicus FF-33]OEE89550.1 UDP-2,3-diacylglucosamine hydrolase [Enterovibrio norvegicus FF-162]
MTPISVRTLWISDLHLGNKDCKAKYLLDFLQRHEAETIVLVGDIVDFYSMKSSRHWPESHSEILSLLIHRAHTGCRLIYVPGNHDAAIRDYLKFDFGRIEVRARFIHETVTGKRIIAVHGDEFDSAVCHSRLTEIAGYIGYDFLLFLNRGWAWTRRKLGFPYWSLASYIKSKVQSANIAIARFEHAAVQYAQRKNADAVVCGHIHHPDIKTLNGTLYLNDGDWIESCTALIEQHEGTIQLIRWTEKPELLAESTAFADHTKWTINTTNGDASDRDTEAA